MSIAENILDAVDILAEKKVSDLQFNKTIRARIAEVVDASIGQYKIQYQNSYFTAYASDSTIRYMRGADVYVEVLSNDFEKNALIIGSVSRLGSNYVAIVEKLDRYVSMGPELDYSNQIAFSSYKDNQSVYIPLISSSDYSDLPFAWQVSNEDISSMVLATSISQAAAAADALKIGVTIKNNLPKEHRTQGNFGIRMVVTYFNAADISDDRETVDRLYQFDINDMIGEPYKMVVPTSQYVIFNIDKENFKEIKSIEAFCEGFTDPKDNSKLDNIWFSNIHLQFLETIPESNLQSSSLNITTPAGNFFSEASSGPKKLRADLRVKGKKVNYSVQNIDFYWFRENVDIVSTSEKFSSYGGNGWELLNKNNISLNISEIQITIDQCPCKYTRFKCVAVFTENGTRVAISSIYTFKNLNDVYDFQIESTAGTAFSFNTGSTILTVTSPHIDTPSNYQYRWARVIDDEALLKIVNPNIEHPEQFVVKVDDPAARIIEYRCSIFDISQGTPIYCGTTYIRLFNSKENNGCTLVIKDGTQVFKYNSYGVSPASPAMATADRMTIPILSFDIYDRQGNLIDIADNVKKRFMTIKWIWPTEWTGKYSEVLNTMLVPPLRSKSSSDEENNNDDSYTETEDNKYLITQVSKVNLITGEKMLAYGIEGEPTFTYGIRDKYNAELANTDSARNNITLEVDYQGEHLVAHTNFTFTKEGELGTNGTKYYARIVPKKYDELLLRNNKLEGLIFNPVGTETLFNTIIDNNHSVDIASIFTAELWDGGPAPIKNSEQTPLIIKWSIAQSTMRSKNARLQLNGLDNQLSINPQGSLYSNIIQATITYENKKFYATYPIPYTDSEKYNLVPFIRNGYREVMYESDGSRGHYNGLPFRVVILNSLQNDGNDINDSVLDRTSLICAPNAIKEDINYIYNDQEWKTVTFDGDNNFGKPKTVTDFYFDRTIEPPSYFIGETTDHWISVKLTYEKKNVTDTDEDPFYSFTTYLPIELYLNRYGMSAMNDWDGNSIQINKDGGYILSPQVGAGRKEKDNSFTGITIGETFQDNTNNKTGNDSQVGMFGYYRGKRSVFIDAGTGDAEFGIADQGQIKIHASDGEGTIYSGDYYNTHTSLNHDEIVIIIHNSDDNKQQLVGLNLTEGEPSLFYLDPIIIENSEITCYEFQSDSFMPWADKALTIEDINNGYERHIAHIDKDVVLDDENNVKLDNENNIIYSIVLTLKKSAGAKGTGLKIKFTSTTGEENEIGPYIKYGSGDFMVDANGHITARGGGDIGGWKIDDENLYSNNETIFLNSSEPKIYGQPLPQNQAIVSRYQRHDTLNSAKDGFYLASDGLSIGSKFKATNDGILYLGQGATKASLNDNSILSRYWTINGTDISDDLNETYTELNSETNKKQTYYVNRSYISYKDNSAIPTIEGVNTKVGTVPGSVYLGTDGMRLGTKFAVDDQGNLLAENLYASQSGEIGGFKIGQTYLCHDDPKTHNTTLFLGAAGFIYGGRNETESILQIVELEKPISVKSLYKIKVENKKNQFEAKNQIQPNIIIENRTETGSNIVLEQKYYRGSVKDVLDEKVIDLSDVEKNINIKPKNANYKDILLTRHKTGENRYYTWKFFESEEDLPTIPKSKENEFLCPHQHMWEIDTNGTAYFGAVKIRNNPKPGEGETANSFNWFNPEGDNLFKLTDTGGSIAGWTITPGELKAPSVKFNGNNGGKKTAPILDVAEATRIYGTGDMSVGGNLSASGGGSIGGASFGAGTDGPMNFPSGILQFNGIPVQAAEIIYVSTIKADVECETTTVSSGGDDSGSGGDDSGSGGDDSGSSGDGTKRAATKGGSSGGTEVVTSVTLTGTYDRKKVTVLCISAPADEADYDITTGQQIKK